MRTVQANIVSCIFRRTHKGGGAYHAFVSEYNSTGLSVVASSVVGSVLDGTDFGTSCLLTV